jgi:hypothetical protein
MKNHIQYMRATVIALFLYSFVFCQSGEVAQIHHKNHPSELDGEVVYAPHGTVAQSEEIMIDIPEDLISGDTNITPSIFFVIDNSGSMWYEDFEIDGETFTHMDPYAHRYTVTQDLIDSVHSRMPEAEVGVGIFGSEMYLDVNDDNLLDRANGRSNWGYIPLLKLNEEYDSDWAGFGTGREILKSYMEIRDGVAPGFEESPLVYRSGAETGTNITTAFDAARHAFENSTTRNDFQYIIFISDGDATIPQADQQERERFMEGNDVPTTYTIFFRSDGSDVPQSIETMTENIKNNGYSPRNHRSRYWGYENSSQEELLKFIMDNVISVIDQNIDAKVKDLIIEGGIGHSGWDGEKIVFDEMFPLTGETTPFDFQIEYTIIDTLIIDGEIDEIIEYDTIVESNYDITLQEDFEIDPERFELRSWWRDFGFYDDNRELDLISLIHDNVELRFTEEARDLFYDYENVEIELRSLRGNDRESHVLQQAGNQFTEEIIIDHEGQVAPDDGVLQVELQDTIIAVFRNPKLPLDTIEKRIPFDAGTLVNLREATYFDNAANGFIDSIFVSFDISGDISRETGEEILSYLTLAPERNFEIIESEWNENGVGLRVKENRDIPRTHIIEGDTIVLAEGTLRNGGVVYASTVTAQDKVAPVILNEGAWLYEDSRAEDTVVIEFSEPLAPVTASGDPFESRRGADPYRMFLAPEYQDEHQVVFSLNYTSPVSHPLHGDSLRINPARDIIRDREGNVQENSENVERKLRVRTPVEASEAVYFDKSGDGLIDSIRVSVHSGPSFFELTGEEIAQMITLPSYRNFTIEDASVENEVVILSVREGSSRPRTWVTSEDELVLEPRGEQFIGDISYVSILDSVAPVIAPQGAVLYDSLSGTDILEVPFSEPVDISYITGNPFLFENPSTPYRMTVTPVSVDEMTVRFTVESSTRDPFDTWDDSLWIHHGVPNIIRDNNGLNQDNPDNIHRPLNREFIVGDIEVVVRAQTPYIRNVTVVPDEFSHMDFTLDQTNEGDPAGMLIQAKAYSTETGETIDGLTMKGRFSVLDPLGNVVAEDFEMVEHEDTESIVYVWNAANANNRPVGSGTYLAIFAIELEFSGERYSREIIRSLPFAVQNEY